MKIGLVVLNYNDSDTVISFLESIQNYDSLGAIVIVDNCSTDDSYNKIQSALTNANQTNTTLIRDDKNKGYASGNNLGIHYLMENFCPDYIVVSNPDVRFSETTLQTIIRNMEEKADAGIISCTMNCKSSIKLPSAWKLPRYKDCLLQDSFIIKKLFGDSTEYPANHFNGDISRVDVMPGSFFALRPSAFIEAGGFDEHTFLYYEENILAWRLKQVGKTNYIVNTCSYDHYHSVSINKNIDSVKRRFDIAYESRLWYCQNYLHINKLQKILMHLFHVVGVHNYLIYKKLGKR